MTAGGSSAGHVRAQQCDLAERLGVVGGEWPGHRGGSVGAPGLPLACCVTVASSFTQPRNGPVISILPLGSGENQVSHRKGT